MREIGGAAILLFVALCAGILFLALVITMAVVAVFPLGEYRPVASVALAVVSVYLVAILVYRIFLFVRPLPEGPIAEKSKEEFTYHVYLLFYLVLFYSLTRSKFIPVPLMRLVYLALGARLGRNTYSSGTILDPPLTFVGSNTIIGQDAVLYSHAIEGRNLSHSAIRIGNDVTVGANAVIMSGVTIGDRAMVASGAVVLKDSNIAPGEIWGGVPARKVAMVEGIRS